MKGAEQVAAYAKGIQLAKAPAVAILDVDTDVWNNLPATTRASALSTVTAAGALHSVSRWADKSGHRESKGCRTKSLKAV